MHYNFQHIEKKWQQHWQKHNIYANKNDQSAPKYFVMDLMPLSTEKGMQVKELFGFFASDVLSRYKKMNGCNVLHPIGFLAHWHFAEKYAKELGKHPSDIFNKNVKRYHKQLKSAGIVFHPSRELNTWEPEYYKWAQWIFIQLFQHYYDQKANKAIHIDRLIDEFEKNGNCSIKAATTFKAIFNAKDWKRMDQKEKHDLLMHYRLAYTADIVVNWCPKLNRYLDADEVKEGFSIKGSHPVEKTNTKQWFLRLTAFTERLYNDLETLNQPEEVNRIQKENLAPVIGANICFQVHGRNDIIEVLTKFPEAIFGTTCIILAHDHKMALKITTYEFKEEIKAYINEANNKSFSERVPAYKKISGRFSGSYVIHPFTGKLIPVYISEQLLWPAAEMVVPELGSFYHWFIKHFNLTANRIFNDHNPCTDEYENINRTLINSEFLNGMHPEEARKTVIQKLEKTGAGKEFRKSRINDFVIGTNKYSGIPLPVLIKNGIVTTCDEKELPFERTTSEDSVNEKSKLNPAIDKPINIVENPGKEPFVKSLSQILETFVYPYRSMDIGNSSELLSKEAAAYWQKPDLVIGNTHHEIILLVYFHFLHKFLYDTGIVNDELPFHTMIDSWTCFFPRGNYYEHNKIPKPENNITDFDTLIEKHGADALRMGVIHNYGQSGYAPRPWDSESLKGAERFLTKLWELYHDDQGRLCISDEDAEEKELEIIHETIKTVIKHLEDHNLDRAISCIMNCLNELREVKCNKRVILKTFAIIISPFAPHIAEELWDLTGDNKKSVFDQPFPVWEKKHLRKTAIYPVCLNGKTAFKTELSLELSREDVEVAILNLSETKKLLKGKKPKRVIVVPGKIVNIVL